MYEAYFRLQKRPFSATPDPGCLFAPEPVQRILNDLMLRVGGGQGIGVLTAGAGLGKTLICRRLAREFEGHFTPILLASAAFPTRRELLQAIHFEMGRRYSGEENEQRLELISVLKGLVHSGRPAALIVDEAHLLNERLLEEIRSLATMFEGDEPLLRVALVGQMPLEMRLIDPAMEALNQRIACHVYLEPLTRQESLDYVAYRMQWAGGDASSVFTTEALEVIAKASNGLPRCLNQLADHSLLLAFVQDLKVVTPEVVTDALNDLKQLPLHWNDAVTSSVELEDGFGVDLDEDEPEESGMEQPLDVAQQPMNSFEPTVAFEIGGESLIEESTSVDETVSAGAGAVDTRADDDSLAEEAPAHESITMPFAPIAEVDQGESVVSIEVPSGERVFQEEFVEDRYAALDQRAPRLSRTFEETRLTGGGARTAAIPLAAAPPQPPVLENAPAAEVRPVEFVESPVAAEGDVSSARLSLAGAYEPSAEPVDDRISALCDGMAVADVIAEGDDVEIEIGNSVLDVCLELRSSLGTGWEATSGDVAAPQNASFVSEPIQYDVVEPEGEVPTRPVAKSSAGGTPGRYVPKPNYRNVFSRLRRRIGPARRD